MMTPDEMIAVIEAHKRGEQIELAEVGSNNWRPIIASFWNFVDFKYRVAKPEPKRVKMSAYIHKDSGKAIFVANDTFTSDFYYRAPWLDGEVEE